MDEHSERRTTNGGQRKTRITAGGVSAPIAILVAFFVNDVWGKQMSQEVVIALSVIIGSMTSIAGVCFYDLRGIALGLMVRRRGTDRKRR